MIILFAWNVCHTTDLHKVNWYLQDVVDDQRLLHSQVIFLIDCVGNKRAIQPVIKALQ